MTLNQQRKLKTILTGLFAWTVALVLFFPIFWMFITSFKTELQAISVPPSLFFEPTLDNFRIVQERSDYIHHAWNSVVTSFGSTIIALVIAIPAAYSMAFFPGKRTKDILLWMLSTKMLPAVGVLVPIYILCRDYGLLDSKTALVIIFTLMNLPIIVWMLFSYFKDLPKEILEAARMDGATPWDEVVKVVLPLSVGAISSTALLSIVLCWNEAFWSLNLTASDAAPLTAMIASYSSPEGLFWAKLSAASTLACAPIVIFGWFCQKQLVQGLTFGAVK
ncbi:carbohydrate ABC transporter permease [Marinomonas sp. UCMA 3892]|jgi:sorbitol/mannitol transport system permease protein|uniref:Sorbitol ABC transporter membrane protein /mannitol ABC transporter membrane protein n=2 Tax=Marinomonas TaxID=28253 RepID=A0A1M5BP10_9GAMM|nr:MULTISPECIES: carbohydrate ABC transporter permease [Marinomonas]MBU1295649.1 carbohydrate ABC transporter permease [Gammaproteobacteria bacterium]NVK73485.1 carbohydrate ABC transporter permease [Oceanospirillaceae bacterium]MBU1468936.1 carbohydrate ABC transporter permease [Gammaproteobacteria bacterium]MBU2022935.1 carbohydrate ABC transporter permease [Gammaproteobacteria bacterium]MBU2238197.1 carbohydrate ABC transporter permease [Gammaproteobacteria bacterium]|tara:strand:+ start:12635 stop:13465 length:831 start_codon:yes stop_codon:yes gene_type:complete